MIFVIVLSKQCYSDNYIVKDSNGNKQFEIINGIIIDKNYNKIGEIKKDGTVIDNNYNKVLKIESRNK